MKHFTRNIYNYAINLLTRLVEVTTGSPLMVPERRLYPWGTVVRCGSLDSWLVYAQIIHEKMAYLSHLLPAVFCSFFQRGH